MIATRSLPINAWLVALDETEHWHIPEKFKDIVISIRGVYLLDRNEITHCCETTPSYWLMHLYDSPVYSDAYDKLTDEEKEEVHDYFEMEHGDDIYVHCHTIDRMLQKRKKGIVYHYGKTGVRYRDSSYDEQLDGIREWANGNPPI